MITVRPLDLDRDVAALAPLLSLTRALPPSEEQIREWWRERLYELNRAAARDNPGNAGVFEPFDGFRQTVFEASWFRPDGQILAADGERWVGLAALVYYAGGVEAYNGFTGVDAAYRGRGLATALKLLAIRQARAYGARTLRTHNDSRNAPMLRVNGKLGYRPQPGIFHLVAACPPAL